MKLSIGFLLFFIVLFIGAQQKIHKVKAKETIYSLTKEYGISKEELIESNPFLNDRGLQIGDELIIPGTSSNSEGSLNYGNQNENGNGNSNTDPEVPLKTEDENYYYVRIEPKETFYNLSKEYQLSIEEIKSVNPALSDGLKIGDVIRIPKKHKAAPTGYHKMEAGQTLYSISKMYNTTVDELLLLNRDVQIDDIPIGAFIKVPGKGNSSTISNNNSTTQTSNNNTQTNGNSNINNGNYQYTVKEGETVFSILNKYDITLDEFVNANPNIKAGLKAGEVVNIPLKSTEKFVEIQKPYERLKDDTIRVGIFLPFYLNDKSKKGQREFSTLFLSGAKLALDSISAQGKLLKVNVYDSSNDREFTKVLSSESVLESDVFIGPVTRSSIMQIRTNNKLSHIPIISPLLKDEVMVSEPMIVFAEVDENTMADKIVEEVAKQNNGNKIFLLTDKKSREVAQYIQPKLQAQGSEVEIISSADFLVQNTNLVTEEIETIFPILVSSDEQMGRDFVNTVENLDNNKTHPYSVFNLDVFEKTEVKNQLANKGFVYIASRKVNTQGYNEKKTIKQYKKDYCQNPDKYAVVGFDVTYDIISRMNDNKQFWDNMNKETTQLATKFIYNKLPSNSFENVGVRVVRFSKTN